MSKAKTSKSPKRSQKSKILQDDEIDEIMENITLKRPRNAYTQFCMDEVEKFKSKNKKEKINLKEFSGECAAKWKKLGDKEKTKYNEKFEQEKIKYRQDIETVRHYLFMDYNDVVHRPPTAYRLFLNERLREGFEKNADPKDVKKKAAEKWRKMSLEEKSEYIEKKKENDTWFEKAKKTRKVNPLTMFVQKAIQTAKEKNANIPKLADLAETWKSLKQSDKDKYVRYAEEINEEREKLYHIYEIIHGVKPKRPAGAFRIFLQEKAKNKELHDIKEGKCPRCGAKLVYVPEKLEFTGEYNDYEDKGHWEYYDVDGQQHSTYVRPQRHDPVYEKVPGHYECPHCSFKDI